jgi:hypothetical protein
MKVGRWEVNVSKDGDEYGGELFSGIFEEVFIAMVEEGLIPGALTKAMVERRMWHKKLDDELDEKEPSKPVEINKVIEIPMETIQ